MWSKIIRLCNKIKYYITMNIKKLFEKTSTGFKEFVAKVDFANVVGLSEELAKYIKKDSNDYLKPNTADYVANINPDIDVDGEIPAITVVYGDGSDNKVYLDLASEDNPGLMSSEDKTKLDNIPNLSNRDILTGIGSYERSKSYINLVYKSTSTTTPFPKIRLESATSTLAGIMSADDKTKIDNYVGTRLNIPNITYVNEENETEYASIGYNGIKYTNGNTVFNVSNNDIQIENDSIKINEEEISFTKGANSVKLNQTGFIVDYTSTESTDTSTSRVTVTNNSIKYKYFIDNSMIDEDNEEGDFTYTLPKANGRLLVDSDNEANPNFVNSDKTKKLTVGYDGIEYNVVTDGYNSIVFNVTDEGRCVANSFYCSNSVGKHSINTTISSNEIIVANNSPQDRSSVNLNHNQLKFTINGNIWDEGSDSTIIYTYYAIKKDNNTYTFPDKSGTIALTKDITNEFKKHFDDDGNLNIGDITNETIKNGNGNNATLNRKNLILSNYNTDKTYSQCYVTSDSIIFDNGTFDDNLKQNNGKRFSVSYNGTDVIIEYNGDEYTLNIEKCIELGILTNSIEIG